MEDLGIEALTRQNYLLASEPEGNYFYAKVVAAEREIRVKFKDTD